MKKRIIIWVVLLVFVAVGVILAVMLPNRRSGENHTASDENVTAADVCHTTEYDSSLDVGGHDPSAVIESLPTSSLQDDAVTLVDKEPSTVSENHPQTPNHQTNVTKNDVTNSNSWNPSNTITVQTTEARTLDPDSPAFIVESVEALPGADDIEVKVRIVNNPGVLGTSLILNYDESVLNLKKAENGEAFLSLNYTPPKKLSNGCIFTWYGETLDKDDIYDGTVLSLRFSVSQSVSEGSFSVALTGFDGNTYNSELSELEFEVQNGFINVK